MSHFSFRQTILAVTAIALAFLPAAQAAPESGAASPAAPQWFKGNTHTHTLNSDGDSSPSVVARWYRDHGYDFLVLSDHNFLTEVGPMQKEIDDENAQAKHKSFLLIPGEEVSDGFKDGQRGYALHVNGLDTTRRVGAQGGPSVRETLQRCIDAIHDAGGLPHVNHPNFVWSLTADDIYSLSRLNHFEIFNGHPYVHNFGGSGHPSLEEMWDDLLTRGRLYYGVAVDDAHHFKKWEPHMANPGRGWIFVRSADLSAGAIIDSITRGDFYASTGVVLDDVVAGPDSLQIHIKKMADFGYRTYFIGKGGAVLKVDETMTPSYTLQPDDLYVRARVVDSGNRFAWTQPVFAPGKLPAKAPSGN